MGILEQKPSEIINPRNWVNFLEIRVKMIKSFQEKDIKGFIIYVQNIKKIARGKLLKTLDTLLRIKESEFKHLRILQELTLDKQELTAVLKN